MALNKSVESYTLIEDLVNDLVRNEPVTARKVNTVVASIGGVVTVLISAAAYLVEHETNLPSWFPLIVTILGIAGTVLKISGTKNGMTSSVANKLQGALTDLIDLTHLHELQEQRANVEDPNTVQLYPVDKANDLRSVAESIVSGIVDRQ